ncbi:hypothetical protein KR093_002154, partial [Drosophila rubida]
CSAMFVRAASVCCCLALLATWPRPEVAAQQVQLYQEQLKQLLQHLMWGTQVQRCLAVITDDLHAAIYDGAYFAAAARDARPYYMLRLNASEQLNPPSARTQLVLQGIRSSGCDLHVITVLNGWQVQQLITFAYERRALHLQHKFLLLHDSRLYGRDMWHVWSVFVRTVFVRRHQQRDGFSLSTIDYPAMLSDVLVLRELVAHWSPGGRIDAPPLFGDKTRDLRGKRERRKSQALIHAVCFAGVALTVAIAEHVPMVRLEGSTNRYQGVEVEIVAALAKALHFQPSYYDLVAAVEDGAALDSDNGTQLIAEQIVAEVARHNARLGIGDLHLFQSYMQHVELSRQHSVECLTFLTPESATDNSWQTFVLPFSGGMWAGVLLSLFVVGTVFYLFSFLNALLLGGAQSAAGFFRCLRLPQPEQQQQQLGDWRRRSFRLQLARQRQRQQQRRERDLFDDYANCILLTYSMLLYVALPRMPRHWPLRVLTGWYWVYCILLVATYRASFTAILANPAARVTIDTLQELHRARIPLATGVLENRQFFVESNDETARELGASMEIVRDIDDVTERIASGRCAYYDNEFYLRHLRVADEARGGKGSTALHIMKECVVHMPVVLALEKNSALKPRVDDIIQHLSEAGLIAKWLRDAVKRLPAEEQTPQEALMNLNKFWSSFVALGIGYLISICALLLERWHFRYVVMQHPLFDVYNPSIYYNFRRLHPHD